MDIDYSKTLTEEFIRNNKNKINWFYISKDQKLNENFIREFQDKVYWKEISKYQKLSNKFLIEFKNKVNWFYLLKKYGYNLAINNSNISGKYILYYKIISNNFNSDYLELNEFIDLAIKLISLKAFK